MVNGEVVHQEKHQKMYTTFMYTLKHGNLDGILEMYQQIGRTSGNELAN